MKNKSLHVLGKISLCQLQVINGVNLTASQVTCLSEDKLLQIVRLHYFYVYKERHHRNRCDHSVRITPGYVIVQKS